MSVFKIRLESDVVLLYDPPCDNKNSAPGSAIECHSDDIQGYLDTESESIYIIRKVNNERLFRVYKRNWESKTNKAYSPVKDLNDSMIEALVDFSKYYIRTSVSVTRD